MPPPPPLPVPVRVSAPGGVPLNWEPGVTVEQLPAAGYPEGTPGGGMFNHTIGTPTRGIWGGSLWLTFHGLQWPYMPKTGVAVSGYAWIDSGYQTIFRPHSKGQRTDRQFALQQGRAVLRFTPTYTDGNFFVQAQVELVGNKDQAATPPLATTDDLWVRIGQWNKWDLQLGRFESWEVYHLGMGLDLNTLERLGAEDFGQYGYGPQPYLVRFSPEVRESGIGYGGMHLYPTGWMRFELLGLSGNDTDGLNAFGTRPAMILDFGMLKLKAAAEYITRRGRDTYNDPMEGEVASKNRVIQSGIGGGAQLILNPRVELGFNASKGTQDRTRQNNSGIIDTPNQFYIWSLGGFLNARLIGDLIAGAGIEFTRKDDVNVQQIPNTNPVQSKAGYFEQLQSFVALQYVISKRVFVKAVGGYARAVFSPGGVPDEIVDQMWSARLRCMYLF